MRSCLIAPADSLSIKTRFIPKSFAIPSRMYRSVGKLAVSVIIVLRPGRALMAAMQS